MIEFSPLSLKMAPMLKRYFAASESRLCDQSLGGALMWRKGFSTMVGEKEGCLFFSSEFASGKRGYTVPLGDFEKGMGILEEHCEQIGEVPVFCSVGEEDKEKLLHRLPEYEAIPQRDWFDYLYLAEKLKDFPGKKLAGQRNHRNYFLKTYDNWRFEEIRPEHFDAVRAYFSRYSEEVQKDSFYFQAEKEAVFEVLENSDVYGFFGGMITIEDRIVAFSLGEIIGDTLFVHVEKAERSVRGAYQMMVSQFVSRFATDSVKYVNREEDVGDPGLRYSKESYHPEKLLSKYVVRRK